jgi:hypothetical protein
MMSMQIYVELAIALGLGVGFFIFSVLDIGSKIAPNTCHA